MTVDRIKVSKEFLGEWISMESPVGENEDPIQCYLELKQTIMDAHDKSNTPAWRGGVPVDGNWNDIAGDMPFIVTNPNVKTHHKPLVINRQDEREYIKVEKEIAMVTSLEELAKYKEYCGKNPDLMTAYTNKLKELHDGITKQNI
jgi:hypothetical protein